MTMGAATALAIFISPVQAEMNQPRLVDPHVTHIQHATHVKNAPTSALRPLVGGGGDSLVVLNGVFEMFHTCIRNMDAVII